MEKFKAVKDEKGIWEIEGLPTWENTYALMIHQIEEGINFKFARYGDGEAICMLQVPGKVANTDGHEYFPDLGQALRGSFSEKVLTGIQPLLLTSKYGVDFMDILKKNLTGEYCNADVLHNASIDLKLSHFLEAIDKSQRPLIVIGSAHLRSFFIDPIVFIEIPDKNCWLKYTETVEKLSNELFGTDNAIVLLCASMMSEVIIKAFEDVECTMIDCGSVFDPFVGVKSRRYHHNLTV